MSETLYRKYRPDTLDDVKGQDHITSILSRGVGKGSIAHAYLFAGTRGIGKTSVARILAKMIGTTERDLYELDAASNRGIDEVRALRKAVHTLPFESPYKVYIIDEVHMLTKEAFNALLKTLEEPPPHVVFVLATTEPEKLPDTIVSRCELHAFKQPTRRTLRDHMIDVAKREKRTLEPGAADLVALIADGSFRDAHGVLQKILSATDAEKLSADDVAKLTGAPSHALVNDIVSALGNEDSAKALGTVSDASEQGMSMRLLSTLILQKLRAVVLLRFVSSVRDELAEDYGAEDISFLEDLAKEAPSINSELIVRFLDASARIDRSPIPSLPLELAIIGNKK